MFRSLRFSPSIIFNTHQKSPASSRPSKMLEDVQHFLMDCGRNKIEREVLFKELNENSFDVGLIRSNDEFSMFKSSLKLYHLVAIFQE